MAGSELVPGERSDTALVLAARGGDGQAFGELFDRWFERSWNVARTILRQEDLAADVAQDAMLAAWQRLDQLQDPSAFGGWLLRIARNRALNRLDREQRSKAIGDDVVSGLRDQGLPDPTGAERSQSPEAVAEVRDRQELVWAAAAALGARDVSLLDLHLRHGLTPAEIADELGVTANNAHQQLFRLRNRLGDAISSYLLWRNGRPLCDGLASAVSGHAAFDQSVARAVGRHQASCEDCSERRAAVVDPGKLFATVPLLTVPAHFKLEAAAALESAGVPMGSSSWGPGDGVDGPTNPADAVNRAAFTDGTSFGPRAALSPPVRAEKGLLIASVTVLVAVIGVAAFVFLSNGQSEDTAAGVASRTTPSDDADQPEPAAPSVTTTEPQSTSTVPTSTTITTESADITPTTADSSDPDPTPSISFDTASTTGITASLVTPDPPTIGRFTSRVPSGILICQDREQSPFEAIWTTDNAGSIVLSMPNVTRTLDPSGSYQFCATTGDVIGLEAIGPGGRATATMTLL